MGPPRKRGRDATGPSRDIMGALRGEASAKMPEDPAADAPGGKFFGGGGYSSFGIYMEDKNRKLREQFALAANLRAGNAGLSDAGDASDGGAKAIFRGLTFWMTGRTCIADSELKRLIVENGGMYEQYGFTRVSHIIADNLATGNQTWRELRRRMKRGHVVTSKWVVDCVNERRRLPELRYMPDVLKASSTMLSFVKAADAPVAAGTCHENGGRDVAGVATSTASADAINQQVSRASTDSGSCVATTDIAAQEKASTAVAATVCATDASGAANAIEVAASGLQHLEEKAPAEGCADGGCTVDVAAATAESAGSTCANAHALQQNALDTGDCRMHCAETSGDFSGPAVVGHSAARPCENGGSMSAPSQDGEDNDADAGCVPQHGLSCDQSVADNDATCMVQQSDAAVKPQLADAATGTKVEQSAKADVKVKIEPDEQTLASETVAASPSKRRRKICPAYDELPTAEEVATAVPAFMFTVKQENSTTQDSPPAAKTAMEAVKPEKQGLKEKAQCDSVPVPEWTPATFAFEVSETCASGVAGQSDFRSMLQRLTNAAEAKLGPGGCLVPVSVRLRLSTVPQRQRPSMQSPGPAASSTPATPASSSRAPASQPPSTTHGGTAEGLEEWCGAVDLVPDAASSALTDPFRRLADHAAAALGLGGVGGRCWLGLRRVALTIRVHVLPGFQSLVEDGTATSFEATGERINGRPPEAIARRRRRWSKLWPQSVTNSGREEEDQCVPEPPVFDQQHCSTTHASAESIAPETTANAASAASLPATALDPDTDVEASDGEEHSIRQATRLEGECPTD